MEQYKKYFAFSGNATRGEYWGVNIISYVALIAAAFAGTILGDEDLLGTVIGALIILVTALFSVWAVFAVSVRRCHEAGINPWFTLALLMPYIAVVPWILFGCLGPDQTVDKK